MIAILLTAGVGNRLGEFTRTHPKCLLPVGGRTLLDRTLDVLANSGVEQTTIVVGHCADQVRQAAGIARGRMKLGWIENPEYRTGSILSLWQARMFLGTEDVLIMDADVLFPTELLRRLVRSRSPSCGLLDGRVEGTGEEMILCASRGRIWDIVRRRAGEPLTPPPGVAAYDQVGESVGFLKLSAPDSSMLSEILEQRVRDGDRTDEYEAAFPELFRRCEVGYERVDDLPWTEIDFPGDVERAREAILPAIEALESVPR